MNRRKPLALLASFLALASLAAMTGAEGAPAAASHDHSAGHAGARSSAGLLPGMGLDVAKLPAVRPSERTRVEDGATISLRAQMAAFEVAGVRIAAYAYDKQIPGPSLEVAEGARITVEFTNDIDMETTVHWHGVRLENRFDGVPHLTQNPIPPGGTFTYELRFPDAGLYWYHPHAREDIQQDAGLYGTIRVLPTATGAQNPVDREQVLVLDDLLLEGGDRPPYGRDAANHAAMGRFGNVLLVNGAPSFELEVTRGEVVRFLLANVASVRPFNVRFGGARMKRVGGDGGSYERESFVESIPLAPAERSAVEVWFAEAREYPLEHVTPDSVRVLGRIVATPGSPPHDHSAAFESLDGSPVAAASIERYRPFFDRPVDHELELTIEMAGAMAHAGHGAPAPPPIEWEDPTPQASAAVTTRDVRWILRDRASGKENMDIDYRFRVGEVRKLRLHNDADSAHPMQHPIHFHGQRFLVLEQDGRRLAPLVWKDTVQIPVGSYVDILLEVSNPGTWMAHCHIAEHLEAGMMLAFEVGS
jgi:FtsP/CotA-like multicopper oxidase with cupredoxin domain